METFRSSLARSRAPLVEERESNGDGKKGSNSRRVRRRENKLSDLSTAIPARGAASERASSRVPLYFMLLAIGERRYVAPVLRSVQLIHRIDARNGHKNIHIAPRISIRHSINIVAQARREARIPLIRL